MSIVAVGSLAWILTADAETSAKVAGAAALLVALLTLGLDIVSFLRQPDRDRPSVQELADDLAEIVRDQWLDEATARRLRDPHVLPLAWSLTTRNVGDSIESITGLAAGGRVTATRFAGRIGDNFEEAVDQLAQSFANLPTRRLVVLGEPGSGKTVLALLLTLGLLKTRTEGAAVPVMLSASTWDPVTERLSEWIARSLATSFYNGRTEVVRRLLGRRMILPIIDGLDEVSEHARRVAIREINDSLDQGSAIVVTCRAVEYQDLVRDGAPRLRGAPVVEVRRLAARDVAAYLGAVTWPPGTSWTSVVDRIESGADSALRAALSTPLIVSMVRMVYERLGGDPAELADEQRFDSRHAIEDHVTGLVIDAAYATAGSDSEPERWKAANARRWLTFLARYMHRYRERDLAWWLMSRRLLGAWVGPTIGVIGGVLLIMAASTWLLLVRNGKPISFQDTSMIGGGGTVAAILITIVWYAAVGRRPGRLSIGSARSSARVWSGFRTGVLVTAIPAVPALAAVAASMTILDIWIVYNVQWYFELVAQMFVVTIIVGCALAVHEYLITPPQRAKRTTPMTMLREDRLSSLVAAFAAGVLVAVMAYPGLVVASTVADLVTGAFMDWPGWPGEWQPVEVALANRQAATVDRFGSTWLMTGVAFVLPGVTFAVLVLLTRAWTRFLLARLILAATGRLPLRLADFLEDARGRQLLRQAGGAYQFRHARLQEHLVSRSPAVAPPTVRRIGGVVVTRRRLAFASVVLIAIAAVPALSGLPVDRSRLTRHGTYGFGTSYALSPDGKRIAVYGGRAPIAVWTIGAGDPTVFLRGMPGEVDEVAFTAGGRTIAAQSGRRTTTVTDDSLRLFDAKDGTEKFVLNRFTPFGRVGAGQSFVTIDDKGTADGNDDVTEAWSAVDGSPIPELTGNGEQNGASDKGTWYLRQLLDNQIEVWTVAPLRRLFVAERGSRIKTSDSERFLVLLERPDTIRIWNATTGTGVTAAAKIGIDGIDIDTSESIQFGAGETRLVVVQGGETSRVDDDAVWLWDTGKETPLISGFPVSNGIGTVSFSENGEILAVHVGVDNADPDDDQLMFWNARTGAQMGSIADVPGGIDDLQLSPDGKVVLLSSGYDTPDDGTDDKVSLFDVAGARLIAVLPGVAGWAGPGDGGFDPTSSIAVTSDSGVRFWSVTTGHLLSVASQTTSAGDVKWFGDGRTAVIDQGTNVEIRDVIANSTRDRFAVLADTNDGEGGGTSIDHDRRFVAAAGLHDDVMVWDLRSGRRLAIFRGHTGPVRSVRFAGTGCHLVTASTDRTVRIWDLPCG
ncbi:NACHT and WD40 repeat domain-containing protein [Virgisporangium ochraceum]|uniref:NACHT and WD40 repeat domain-containing protein n=1 Tax=Virgisporangium ochraceum TaxID=65505 RepID=UPI00194360AB|nr:NACHT domain-containing protein [Virgisporangium ochraceum]